MNKSKRAIPRRHASQVQMCALSTGTSADGWDVVDGSNDGKDSDDDYDDYSEKIMMMRKWKNNDDEDDDVGKH